MRYGFRNVLAIRRSNKTSRKYFPGDLRQAGGRNSREIEIPVYLCDDLHESSTDKKIEFTEIDIPSAMSTYNPTPEGIANHVRPDRAMANLISQEPARGQSGIPA